jgi:NAD(P)-dependent dehydrogenase (short-subunit alcohol dehydrogenase family)
MYAAIGHMKAQGGVILNMASIAGTAALADRFAYSMTKGAVVAMTYSVAKDYLAHKIRCNCISPARVHTPFVDGYLRKNYPGREQEMFQSLSGAWASRKKLPPWLFFFARKKPRLSPEPTIPSTEDFSTSVDEQSRFLRRNLE